MEQTVEKIFVIRVGGDEQLALILWYQDEAQYKADLENIMANFRRRVSVTVGEFPKVTIIDMSKVVFVQGDLIEYGQIQQATITPMAEALKAGTLPVVSEVDGEIDVSKPDEIVTVTKPTPTPSKTTTPAPKR